jgi:hypothetical protein
MTHTGLEPSRRRAAIQHTNKSYELATIVRDRWIRVAEDQPPKSELKIATNYLHQALSILLDDRAMHQHAAQSLEDAARCLLQLNEPDPELAEALRYANLALAEVAEHRPTISGGSAPK